MKFLLLILFSVSVYAQDLAKDLYNKGQTLTEATYENNLTTNYLTGKGKVKEEATTTIKNLHLKALEYYDELVKNYPGSEYYADALFEKANIEYWDKSHAEAKESFKKILSLTNYDYYKNQALVMLATIEIDEKNYSQAIDYLDESKKYKKSYTCGNEIERDQMILETLQKGQ